MAFEPPEQLTRLEAIGPTNGLPVALQRAFTLDKAGVACRCLLPAGYHNAGPISGGVVEFCVWAGLLARAGRRLQLCPLRSSFLWRAARRRLSETAAPAQRESPHA